MAAEYDDFECRLRERLLTIAEEIDAAKESGRASMADPTNKVGRALAAQQIKIKEAERSRVAAMLAGVQQQQSESVTPCAKKISYGVLMFPALFPPAKKRLQMATFTSDYVKLMQTSSRVGPTLSEKQVEGVVNAYQNRLDGTHAVGSLLTDSAEDTLETSLDGGVNFLTGSDETDSDAYAKLFGVADASPAVQNSGGGAANAGVSPALPVPVKTPIAPLPDAPTQPVSIPQGHRRAKSIEADSGVGWMFKSGEGM